ncbi:MAG: SDR family NAD(P)-dependent oxidoreductase [Hyphomicrobiales bacterium]|nr:SDR family NAD(P)-dependent oxidoreductase [Hyphomicrobiales bacterium]MDE1971770.1 SDR family NAD(P)-dependent oxidoreductase [Hyphomicrobiales bacterium]
MVFRGEAVAQVVKRPKRKNPVERTRLPTLPPATRSRVALGLTAAAARGRFELQVCRDCGAVQYPPREVCRICLSQRLFWRRQDGMGELISDTTLHAAQELFFRERLPWRIGDVRLDSGVNVIAYVHHNVGAPPCRIRIEAALDRSGQAALVAMPERGRPALSDDPKLREMTCNPRARKILVTDGKSAVGQAVARALAAAGADLIWIGMAEPWKKSAGFDALRELPQAKVVPLDVTDSRSVRELAGEIGGKVDILVNTSDCHRAFSLAARRGVETAQLEMDVNYFGLLRLAQEFAPTLKARAADGDANAIAWVNVLSVFALSNYPPHGTYSASKAAAWSLSQNLRADLRPAGVRVINLFPGPVDDEWDQLEMPPKLSPAALAAALVQSLQGSVEDVYPGDVAQDWLARNLESPKTLERELGEFDR